MRPGLSPAQWLAGIAAVVALFLLMWAASAIGTYLTGVPG